MNYIITEGDLMDFASMSSSEDRWELVDKIKHRANAHVAPITGTELKYVQNIDDGHYDPVTGRVTVEADIDEANVITSRLLDDRQQHYIILDVDFPVKAIPSTTPGHFHLYIEKAVYWEEYVELLDQLADMEIVEGGYVEASKREGYTSARLPWVKKQVEAEGPVIIPSDPTVPYGTLGF